MKLRSLLAYGLGIGATSSEGQERYDSTRETLRVYDSVTEKATAEMGFMPYAHPIGMSATLTTTTALALAASGGAVAFPVVVEGHMIFSGAEFWSTDTAQARGPVLAALYEERANNSNTLDKVVGTDCTRAAYTPTAAATRNLQLDNATPLYIPPGCYWAVMKNDGTARTASVGCAAAGTMANNVAQTKTLATGAMPSTLDMVAATWTKITTQPQLVMHGQVFGTGTNF